MSDTIAALATPPGRSAVAVIRLSGPDVRRVLAGVGVAPGPARRACLRAIRAPGGDVLDRALTLWFPAPHSYTGEDCAELHVHGSRYVTQAILTGLLAVGARLADPGEFTRRAFEHGKLDLAQAEAVADLVEAETAAQTRQALAQLGGALTARQSSWRAELVSVQARLEAAVDFPDEDLAPDLSAASASLHALHASLCAATLESDRGAAVREGWRVAIIGPPNAGKSTLLNALAGREAAIVTDIAGTTRDVIEVPMDVCGYRVILADTAGLRETADPIEGEGVRRAIAWAAAADRRLWVVDASQSDATEPASHLQPGDLCILNKTDLPRGGAARAAAAAAETRGAAVMALSLSAEGAEPVRDWLARALQAALGSAEFPAATRSRHRRALREATSALEHALQALDRPELAAEDVRLAGRALQRITGAIGAEDVLDQVFASFCIGK